MSAEPMTNLNGWHWVEWRNTLEPELFRDGQIRDLDGDWIRPSPTRKIGPRIPEPKELKATELELAKLRNRVDDLDKTLDETREERDRLRAALSEARQFIANGIEFGFITVLCDEIDRLRKEVMRLKAIISPESAG